MLGNQFWALALLLSTVFYSTLNAVDHNNIDAGRPLSFEDAQAIARREIAAEAGVQGSFPNAKNAGLGIEMGILYGLALNSHAGIELEAASGGRTESNEQSLELEEAGINFLHNFNREYGNVPALAIKTEMLLPVEENSRGVEIHLRGILSKSLVQYDRLHLNLDGVWVSDPSQGERNFRPGGVAGLSLPLGYPKKYTLTGLGEVALRTPKRKGSGPLISLGLGLRQQITVNAVMDFGLHTDIIGGGGVERENLKITAGYSIGF